MYTLSIKYIGSVANNIARIAIEKFKTQIGPAIAIYKENDLWSVMEMEYYFIDKLNKIWNALLDMKMLLFYDTNSTELFYLSMN
jgi:hypothetical protein